MHIPTQPQRTHQVQLKIPLSLLHDLDKVATALSIPRTHLILRALRRDLQAMMQHEARKALEQKREFVEQFGRW